MEKLTMQTPDLTQQNIEKIASIFPNVITEAKNETGEITKAIDFDLLKQELSNVLVEDGEERYRLDWPGKKDSILRANTPIKDMTLRPIVNESVDFENTENIYIEGDNFEVLKLLQESYLNKIKVIYIDPPYNTGTAMIYKNDFSVSDKEYSEEIGAYDFEGGRLFKNTDTGGRFHSNWLSMMYERLVVAKDLLSEDGFMAITIDHNELHNLTAICDEIFGEDNRIGVIAVRNNPAGRSTAKGVSITHEYALFYSKSDAATVCRLPRTEKQIDRYGESDNDGAFEWINFRKPGSKKAESPRMFYPIFVSDTSLRVPAMEWNNNSQEWDLKEQPEENETVVFPIDDDGKERRWRWAVDTFKNEISDLKPKFLKDRWHVYLKGRIPNEGVLPNTWWDKKEYSSTAYGANLMKTLFGELQIFSYPKSIYAVIDSLRVMSANKNDVFLDFFSGSATTAHAVMELNAEDGGNRKFIMVQLPEETEKGSEAYTAGYRTIAEIGRERIRRSAKSIKNELEAKGKQLEFEDGSIDPSKLDFGFRVYKTDSTNMKDVYYNPSQINQDLLAGLEGNIKPDRSGEDLLTQVILDLGLELSLKMEKKEILGNTVYFVAENSLVACFDEKINIGIVDEIAQSKPLKVVFRDAGFADDKDRINVEERFKRLSPDTIVRVI